MVNASHYIEAHLDTVSAALNDALTELHSGKSGYGSLALHLERASVAVDDLNAWLANRIINVTSVTATCAQGHTMTTATPRTNQPILGPRQMGIPLGYCDHVTENGERCCAIFDAITIDTKEEDEVANG